jgi:hypothetical protein
VRLYPRQWRTRYGDEFIELLVAEMDERPRSWRRTLDVAGHAGLARLRVVGILGRPVDAIDNVGLATAWAALGTFFVVGASMWSQVMIGWRWEPPTGRGVAAGMWLMSGGALLAGVVGLLAAVPVAWTVLRAFTARRHRGLLAPTAVTLASGLVLVTGSAHFREAWPGTGGHVWAYHRLVPARMSAFVWAATRGLSAYWLHPSALRSFRPSEVAWMATSLVATAMGLVGLSKIIRRLDFTPAVRRAEITLARAAAVVALFFLAGAACWVIGRDPAGPTGIYRVGTIDVVGLAVMAAAWAACRSAVGVAEPWP